MKRIICISIVCAVILCTIACPVLGTTDLGVDENTDLHTLFLEYAFPDGNAAKGELVSYYLGKHFLEDPTAFIRALAEEEEAVIAWFLEWFPNTMYHDFYPGSWLNFPDAVFSVKLTGSDSKTTKDILAAFESSVEKLWGVTNPKTGDPIWLITAAMSASVGALILLRKRKDA